VAPDKVCMLQVGTPRFVPNRLALSRLAQERPHRGQVFVLLNRQDLYLTLTDFRFDVLDQLRRHFADAVFLCVLSRFPEYRLFRLTPHDLLTPARRIVVD
jgi:hypothetical protein